MTAESWDTGFDYEERRVADTARDAYARAWLQRLLEEGETSVSVIVAEGRIAGISRRRIGRAADALGVVRRGHEAEATWHLPAAEAP
jgi:hypothetical protein